MVTGQRFSANDMPVNNILFKILFFTSGSAASELSHDDDDLSSTSGASSRSHSPFPPGGTVEGERTGRVLPSVSTEGRNVKKMLWRQRRKCHRI